MEPLLEFDAAVILAECRRDGTLSHIPLNQLASRSEAEEFQQAAVSAFGGEQCGYKIGATSVEIQRLLSCGEPIFAPIRPEDVLASGSIFQIPEGLMGVECEFGFLMDRDFPAAGDVLDVTSLRSAIADCFMALEFVGRRLGTDVPINEMSSIADFGLNVAAVRGESIPGWKDLDLATMPVHAVRDGLTIAEGTGALVLGHPLDALLWLAEALHKRGNKLKSGEIILTGSCTGVTKVSPGQVFEGRFAEFAPIQVRLAPG